MTDLEPRQPNLQALIAAQNSDLIAQLLAEKRSPQTRHAYYKDLRDFFRFLAQHEPTPELVQQFLSLSGIEATTAVLRYKAHLIQRHLKEATINRRLSAIRSLVRLARQVGQCDWTLDISSERVTPYRDTTGISCQDFRRVLETCDRATLLGLRNYALLRLLWDNALRRGEVSQANVGDFDAISRTLKIHGKGRGSQIETIQLAPATVEALQAWLNARPQTTAQDPLFISLDNCHRGHRLTGSAIYWTVSQGCKAAGISKVMSPHRIRHSAITSALDATEGNIRKAQKLSRHKQINTLMIYDDNRNLDQLELSQLLADMMD